MTSTQEPLPSELPAPGTTFGRRLVAFVEFAGPVTVEQIAEHLGAPRTMVDNSCVELRNIGYLKYISMPLRYESRHRWNPDDAPHAGAPSGPHTPMRYFRDGQP